MRAWRRSAPAGALVVLTLVAYATSFSAGLPLDSAVIVGDDPRLREVSWGAVQDIFTHGYWWPALSSDLYRPLTTLTYWLNYAVLGNGTAPLGYHVVNFLVHAGNVLLAYRLASRIGARPVAWLTAAAFAVHPLGVEAVTNVVGRADLLATTGILGACLAWLRGAEASTRARAIGWRVVAGALALAAVLAKETGVMAIAAVALLEWPQRRAQEWRRVTLCFAPALLAFAISRWALRDQTLPLPPPFLDNPIAHAGFFSGSMTAIGGLGRFLSLCVWPASLSSDYSYSQIRLFGDGAWATLQPCVALAVIVAGGIWLWQKRNALPLAAAGGAWMAVMLLPTSNLVVKIGSIFAERFFYLPLLGAMLLAATCWDALAVRFNAKARWSAGWLPLACLAALTARTMWRNLDWRSDRELWRAAVVACPESYKAHKGYGAALFNGGATEADVDRAIAEGEQALRRLKEPPLPLSQDDVATRVDLGMYYRVKGEHVAARVGRAEARAWFERSLVVLDEGDRINAWTDAEVRRRWIAQGKSPNEIGYTGNADAPIQRGHTLIELGLLPAAEEAARAAQRLAPGRIAPLSIFARIDHANGNFDAVAVRLLEVILINRDYEQAWRDLERLYARLGLAAFIGRENGVYGIDLTNPRVRAHLNTAFVDMVRAFREAKAQREAQVWIERAVRDYGCPLELFGAPGAK